MRPPQGPHLFTPRPRSRYLHRVLGGLDGAGADDLAGRLGLEGHRLAREGVGALARLGGGLLDDDEFCKARDQEDAGFLELLVTDRRERLDDALDVLLRQLRVMLLYLLDQLRLRQMGRHVASCWG